MTEIKKKALALVNEVRDERDLPSCGYVIDRTAPLHEALCRAIEQHEAEKAARAAEREQHEAFRQEVSEIVEQYIAGSTKNGAREWERLKGLIIAKPDPLVEHLVKVEGYFPRVAEEVAGRLRTARGLKIVEDK